MKKCFLTQKGPKAIGPYSTATIAGSCCFMSGMLGVDPETGKAFIGDIVISIDRARAQAREYGHSLTRELGYLTAHAMLHLMGYDHMEEDERLEMEQRQREILDSIGITR